MSYGTSSYGDISYGEPGGEEAGGTVNLSAVIDFATARVELSATIDFYNYPITASVKFDNRPYPNIFAVIDAWITEAVDLYAGISLAANQVDLSATINFAARETLSPDLSATISLQTADQTLADATAAYWTLKCVVGGTDISGLLTGDISVEYEEDASGLATIVLHPNTGAILLTDYVAKPITLTYQQVNSAGTVLYEQLLFRGYVSDPLYEPAPGTLTLECTTDLQGALDNQARAEIEALTAGSWSPFVFEEGAQGYDYAMDRMRTRAASMWHSPGGIIITDWAAKETADIELADSQIVAESISYENASRRDLLNKVGITFDYRFQRQRQRTINVVFGVDSTFCNFLINGFNLPQRSMIETISSGGGWYLQGAVNYVDLPPTGYYRCFPFAPGSSAKYIGWGNLVGGLLLDDPDTDLLCWGASWKVAKRWGQSITERYSIAISAPQSRSGNGDIAKTESYSMTCDQDISDWIEDERFQGTGVKEDFAIVGDSYDGGSYVLGDVARDATDDELTGRDAADLAREVMIAAAVTDVLQAHRSTRLRFMSTFQPFINLTKTVRIDTDHVTAKGKVRRTTHKFGINSGEASTEVELAISRHFGSGLVSSSPITPDDPPEKLEETNIPRRKYLTSHVGGRTDSLDILDSWDGYFTNYIYDPTNTEPFASDPQNPQTVIYPETFICEYPEISGAALDTMELPAEQEIDVEIPEDEFSMTQ